MIGQMIGQIKIWARDRKILKSAAKSTDRFATFRPSPYDLWAKYLKGTDLAQTIGPEAFVCELVNRKCLKLVYVFKHEPGRIRCVEINETKVEEFVRQLDQRPWAFYSL